MLPILTTCSFIGDSCSISRKYLSFLCLSVELLLPFLLHHSVLYPKEDIALSFLNNEKDQVLRNFLDGGLGALSPREVEERLRSWDDKDRRAPRSFSKSGSCTGSDVDDDAISAKVRGSVNQAGRTNDRKRKTVNFRYRHLLWTSRTRWGVWMSRRSQTGKG